MCATASDVTLLDDATRSTVPSLAPFIFAERGIVGGLTGAVKR